MSVRSLRPLGPSAAPDAGADGVSVQFVLTEGAQVHVLRYGMRPRLAVLMEQADKVHHVLNVGDSVALSESARLDLHVLRRRLLVEQKGITLEITLDIERS